MLEALNDTISSPVFLTLVVVIGGVIQVAKSAVFGKEKLSDEEKQALAGLKRVFFVTIRLQAMLFGGLCGFALHKLVAFEVPATYDAQGTAGALLFGTLAGATAQIAYTSVIGAFRDFMATKSKA
jgi:hypothetical protein